MYLCAFEDFRKGPYRLSVVKTGHNQLCFLRTHAHTCEIVWVFYCWYYKLPQIGDFKQHTLIFWQFYRLEPQPGTYWTKIELFILEALGNSLIPYLFQLPEAAGILWLMEPSFLHLHSQHPCISLTILPVTSLSDQIWEVQFSSVTQSCPTLCDPMDCSMPGLPVHHQFPEFIQTHVHWLGDAIQPSHHLSSLSQPTFNLSQHQGLFQWVSPLHQVAKLLKFQLQHQSLQWIFRTYLGWTGWISLQSKGLSRVFSNTTVQKHQFFGAQLSL